MSYLSGMMRATRSAAAPALGLVVLAFVGGEARANGRFPAANQLVFSPASPNVMALRSTFGIMVTQDQGNTWGWSCEQAVPYTGIQNPSTGFTANGNLVLGLVEGLALSTDNACDWTLQAGTFAFIVDTVVRPDNPSTVLALQNVYTGSDDAGDSLYQSQVYVSTDNGVTFTALGVPLNPTYVLETLEVAPTDPNRIYVSGFNGQGTSSQASLFVSTDLGMHWTPYPIPFDPTVERAPFIAGVDPTDADRVYIRTSNAPGGASRFYYTADAGKTVEMVFSGIQLMGFAQSTDGSTLYIGGPDDGLLVASRSEMAFTLQSNQIIQCLAYNGGLLYACSAEGDNPDAGTKGGFALGTSSDNGATFTPLLHLECIQGPLACAPSASESACVDSLAGAERGARAGPPAPGALRRSRCGHRRRGGRRRTAAAQAHLEGRGLRVRAHRGERPRRGANPRDLLAPPRPTGPLEEAGRARPGQAVTCGCARRADPCKIRGSPARHRVCSTPGQRHETRLEEHQRFLKAQRRRT